MSTVVAYAEEAPCSWNYKPDDRLVTHQKPRWGMGKSKSARTLQRDRVGPGLYHDGVVSSQKLVLPTAQRPFMPKAQSSHAIAAAAERKKYVPGVGTYKDLEKASNYVQKKNRLPGIFPYKTSRFTDDVVKSKKWVPGPGSYHIGPPVVKAK